MSLTKDVGGILFALLAAGPGLSNGGPGGRDLAGGDDLRKGRLDVALFSVHGLLDEAVEALVQHGLAVRLDLFVELRLLFWIKKREGREREVRWRGGRRRRGQRSGEVYGGLDWIKKNIKSKKRRMTEKLRM
jgi:hypothetical protein